MTDAPRRTQTKHLDRYGIVFAAAAMTIVGSSVAAASIIVNYPVLGGQAIRYAIASGLLFGWARLSRSRIIRPGVADLGWLILVALVGMAGFNVLLIAATARTDPSLVGAILGTAPIALAILGGLQARRRPSVSLVLGAVVVAIGVAVIEQARLINSSGGILLAVGAMLGEVGFSLLAVPPLRNIGPIGVSAHGTWIAAAMLAIATLFVGGPNSLRMPSAVEAAALAYLAAVVTAVAFVLWYSAVERIGAGTAGLFAGLIPISALVTATLIHTDALTLAKFIGAIIVGIGVAFGLRDAGHR